MVDKDEKKRTDVMEIDRGNENLRNVTFSHVQDTIVHVLQTISTILMGRCTCLVKFFQRKIVEKCNVSATLLVTQRTVA
jgi:hypothetical protein